MLELIGLVVAVTGIVALARGRGANPVLMGTITVAGWVLIEYGGLFIFRGRESAYPLMIAAWAWVGLIFVVVRFVVGAGKPKPDGKWNCPECRYLNNASSVICEACQTPWKAA